MITGRYRLRRGWFGKAIMQYEFDSPNFIGGYVDVGVRQKTWHDVRFDNLANIAVAFALPIKSESTLDK